MLRLNGLMKSSRRISPGWMRSSSSSVMAFSFFSFFIRHRPLFRPQLPPAKAIHDVIVDHPDRLHMRVANGTADETEPAPLQIFAQRVRQRGAGGNLGNALPG